MTATGEDAEAICVGVRLRPFVAYETGQKQCLKVSGSKVSIVTEVAGREHKDFQFDEAMDSMDPSSPVYVSQAKCYELMAKRMVQQVFQGYNTCLFCYGQTGTGKTTTIMGKCEPNNPEQGLLPRMLGDVFLEAKRMEEIGCLVHIKVQMLEVYNEKIKDLLLPRNADIRHPCDVHVHPKLGVYLKGVTEEAVESWQHCIRLIDYGNTMKTVAATAMNAKSSRAHTVFKLTMEKRGGSDNMSVTSEVFFVDLAGRENEKTTKVTGERFAELTFINRSLMWLAHCIEDLGHAKNPKRKTVVSLSSKSMAPVSSMNSNGGKMNGRKSLAPGSKGIEELEGAERPTPRKSLAPGIRHDMAKFRNSKLTLLLSNALSGNSKTAMIGTLSPAVANFEESFSTLNFCNTVKNIKVDARPAAEIDKDSIVEELREELRQLKDQLGRMDSTQEQMEGDEIRHKIECTGTLSEKMRKRWEDNYKESAKNNAEREKAMLKIGARWKSLISLDSWMKEADHPLPYLANYNEDAHLSGRLMLHPAMVDKEYCIGYSDKCDFMLPHGLGMLPKTCYLKRDFGRLFLRAHEDTSSESDQAKDQPLAEVNGVRVGKEWVELQHQDCVVLGRSLMFYAFTKADGGMQALPATKQHLDKEGSESSEALLSSIIGPARAADHEQVHLARSYYSYLQSQNLDAEGATSLHNFLLQACRAMKMVDQANEITAEVKPKSNLSFELTAMAPVLSFGFGSSSFPEICVRLVRKVPERRAKVRLSMEKLRRKSVFADYEMLRRFTNDGLSPSVEPENAKVEVVHTWHFPKFTARLQLMQDVHEAWTQDPETFFLDPYNDPWSEFGLSEIAQLKQEKEDKLEQAHDELRLLRRETDMRDSSLVHSILTRETGTEIGEGSARKTTVDAVEEVMSLRESHRQLEFSNAQLKAELSKAQADAKAYLKRLAAASGGVVPETSAGDWSGNSSRSGEPATEKTSKAQSAASSTGEASASSDSRGCLELSKANLSLVEDLFRLSIALLRAGTASLQTRVAEQDVTSSLPSGAQAQQGRLADAASELVAFLANANVGPLATWGQAIEAAATPSRSMHSSPIHSTGASLVLPVHPTSTPLYPHPVAAVAGPAGASLVMPVGAAGSRSGGSVRIHPGPARSSSRPVSAHGDPQAPRRCPGVGMAPATAIAVQSQWPAPMRARSTTPDRPRPTPIFSNPWPVGPNYSINRT